MPDPGGGRLMPRRDPAAVDATGTRRRIQALGFIGHTRAALAAQLGTTADHLTYALYQPHVPEDLARRVRRVYNELWDVVPAGAAADRARASARHNRWVSPLAWDDDDIDDPAAVPQMGERTGDRAAALKEDSDWLLRFGYPLEVAAERLGVTAVYLRRARERARRAGRERARRAVAA